MLRKLSKTLSRIAGAPAAGSGRDHRKPRRFRPGVESLEDRSVPATFFVNTLEDEVKADNFLSLREAISRANANPGLDTIRLGVVGTYTIKRAGNDNNSNDRGDFDVHGSLTIVGLGAGLTAIDGGAVGERLFDVDASAITFANLALSNGGNDQSFGGAVQAVTANVTLTNCLVTGNRGLKGGAINAENGNVTLNNSTMRGNRSLGTGGAIHASNGDVVLVNSRVTGNTASKEGGGIFAGGGNITLRQSTVSGCQANAGGGLFAGNGDVMLVGSTVANNREF